MTVFLSFAFCIVLICLDQLFKFLVTAFLKPIEYIDVIENVLRFRYVENTGAVFGSFATHTLFLTVFSVVLLGVVIFYLIKNRDQSKFVNLTLLLMIAGGIGNVIDRIRLQYVIDYIEPLFIDFAVFNFADCLITVGAFSLMIYLIIDLIKDIKKEKASKLSGEKNNGNN